MTQDDLNTLKTISQQLRAGSLSDSDAETQLRALTNVFNADNTNYTDIIAQLKQRQDSDFVL
mgnify:CR=1 FL=1|jgi:hypothetical protein